MIREASGKKGKVVALSEASRFALGGPGAVNKGESRPDARPSLGSLLNGPVVVIDDDPSVQRVLREILEDLGCEVVVCASGDEGFVKTRELQPALVLVDVRLPDQNGFELLGRIRKMKEDASVIVISTDGHPHTIVRAMKRGADDFLTKPFSREEARRVLEETIERIDYRLEVERLRTQLAQQSLQQQHSEHDRIFRNSAKMREIKDVVDQVADTDATVLIWGESGVGKELVARAVHQRSSRRSMPFVKVNCAALPLELLESELFGYERGAFTGAYREKPGKFELADRGVIFLDEIGEMPMPLQAKLLQVVQDREFSRLGSRRDIRVDARVVVSTNRDLVSAVGRKEFREDLYYRLNIVNIHIPPLRERLEEVPALVEHFWMKYSAQYNRCKDGVSADALRLFMRHNWPGNVRQLENMVKRIVILNSEEWVETEMRGGGRGGGQREESKGEELTDGRGLKEATKRAIQETERAIIKSALDDARWNRVEAAKRLKISYKSLLNKIQAYGLAGNNPE